MRNQFAVISSSFLTANFFFAKDSISVVTKRTCIMMPVRNSNAPEIDGVLDDEGWNNAE